MNTKSTVLATVFVLAASMFAAPAMAEEASGSGSGLVLRCIVDTEPSTVGKVVPPSDIKLDADAALPVPSFEQYAGLPDAPKDDLAGVSISPSAKLGNGPDEVSTDNLTKPHKKLGGDNLIVWNQFCEGRDPKAVGQWRYKRCNGLDDAFAK